ncbi:MAG: 16S rRNA (cytidine(1402)-2'-O)-methyltransferase [Coriobacteriia bacterium]|nr:16S rRNA (cytidine(1402)-2'-O)-methyltransferase [Coriobacteriia bacterium]
MESSPKAPKLDHSVPPALREGKLVICPTPLGNLGDLTERTRCELEACDVVCCEDTRVTGHLLAALGIEKRLERLDENSIGNLAPRIIERVAAGEVIAYASDAGMPGISDPGQRLVDLALSGNVGVEVLPGPTAVATAYVAAGFPSRSFYFGAFFPRKLGERIRVLEQLKPLDACLVFYESPLRIVSALQTVSQVFPHRRVAVCRELTKLHEEITRGNSSLLFQEFQLRERMGSIKGEIVMVIEPPTPEEAASDASDSQINAKKRVGELMEDRTLSRKDVMKKIQREFGISRNEAYDLVLEAFQDK